jgi:hypothetical protein
MDILAMLKEVVEENDSIGGIFLKMASKLKFPPFMISAIVIIDSMKKDDKPIEWYTGRLITSGKGLVLFESSTKNNMVVVKDDDGIFRFRSLSKELFSWNGRLKGNELYLARDRDTYQYSHLSETDEIKIRLWLNEWC